MPTPGKGNPSSRIRDQEARGEDLLRSKDPPRGRESAPQAFRNGRWKGITLEAITRDSPGEVKLVKKITAGYKSCQDLTPADVVITAGCYLLNSGESIPADTAVKIEFDSDNTWDIYASACKLRNWQLVDEEE